MQIPCECINAFYEVLPLKRLYFITVRICRIILLNRKEFNMDADNCPTVGGRCDSEHESAKKDDDLSESGSIMLREGHSV